VRWPDQTAGSVGVFQRGQHRFILIFCFFSIKEKEKEKKYFGIKYQINESGIMI